MNRGIFAGFKLIKHLADYSIENLEYKQEIVQKWSHTLSKENFNGINEQALKGRFLVDVFEEILGYKTRVGEDEWTMQVETKTEADGTTPDAALGYFKDNMAYTLAVVEVKGASTGLDDKQKRKDDRSTVEQAFAYRHKYTNCEWVIITNFREIRLYSKDSSLNYELFKIEEMAEDILLLERFCFLLGVETLILPKKKLNSSKVEKIYRESVEFYKKLMHYELSLEPRLSDVAVEKHKQMLSDAVQRKICKARHTLGEFVEIECGLPFASTKGTDFLETFEFSRFWSGTIEPFKPIQDIRYIKSEVLENFHSFDEKFFHRKRILLNRFKPTKPLERDLIKATIAEESFFNGKELLNLLVTDDRLSTEYLLGLLNSKMVWMWYKDQVQSRAVADYVQFVPTDLKKIPIALPSPENQQLVEETVRGRLNLEKKLIEEQEHFLNKMSYFPNTEKLIEEIRKNKYQNSLFIKEWFDEVIETMPIKKARSFGDLENSRQLDFYRKTQKIKSYKRGCDGVIAKVYGLTLEEFLYVRDPLMAIDFVGSKK